MFSGFICDCGDQHLDNPFCYYRHLKYNRVINSDSGVIEAALAENVLSVEEAGSLRVTSILSRLGDTNLHRELFGTYLERLNSAANSLKAIGYNV